MNSDLKLLLEKVNVHYMNHNLEEWGKSISEYFYAWGSIHGSEELKILIQMDENTDPLPLARTAFINLELIPRVKEIYKLENSIVKNEPIFRERKDSTSDNIRTVLFLDNLKTAKEFISLRQRIFFPQKNIEETSDISPSKEVKIRSLSYLDINNKRDRSRGYPTYEIEYPDTDALLVIDYDLLCLREICLAITFDPSLR